jgi:ribosomal protein S15P/S13E
MGFWPWFWIWIGLGLSSLIVLALIASSLYNKLGTAAHQANRLLEKAKNLANAIETKPKVVSPQSSVESDPAIAKARRLKLQKQKIKKQEQRRRRLIASLKRFDPNESRFH